MNNILKDICEDKKQHIARRKEMYPLDYLKQKIADGEGYARPFAGRIMAQAKKKETALIAEIKKSSPSKGIIRQDFDPPTLAMAYQEGGATCLSVLTDVNYFGGNDEYIEQVKAHCKLPVLRKDFIFDPYQVYESRAIGADAILLIQSILSPGQVHALASIAKQLGMAVLLEVHNEKEAAEALQNDIELVGINNRNLKNFEVSLSTTLRLAPKLRRKKRTVICESGIANAADIAKISKETKTYGFLVGEALMKEADVEGATRRLLKKK